MASVHRRVTPTGSVIYRAIWTEPGPGGTRRKRSKNFERAGEAKAFASRMEQEVEKRGVGDPQKHTLEGFLKRWIATLADRGEHSPTTLAAYRWQSGIACRYIGHIPLEKLSPADLDELYAIAAQTGRLCTQSKSRRQQGRAAIDRAHRAACASRPDAALQQARKWKMIGENPAKDATAPTPSKSRVKAFTADQVTQLLAAAERDVETYVITALFLACGLRRSEVLGLAWDCVDLDRGTHRNQAHGSSGRP